MTSSIIVSGFAFVGIIVMSVWGQIDKRVDNIGATITGALLIAAVGCGLSGHMVPEGAWLLVLAVFSWIFTLIGSHDWRQWHK